VCLAALCMQGIFMPRGVQGRVEVFSFFLSASALRNTLFLFYASPQRHTTLREAFALLVIYS
ncbi:MAG: hypothetical protein K5864_09295, partial [Bacteroidales bacterium]|nr:hypothetical protein [Bacteroidales bacterium]